MAEATKRSQVSTTFVEIKGIHRLYVESLNTNHEMLG